MNPSHSAIIIDDSATARKSLASVIRQYFNMSDIYTTSSAREASGVLRQIDKVDWIFCDNKLADLDTYKFLNATKKIKSASDSKVLLLSADGGKETLMKAASHGVDDIILKPFTPKIVIEKVRRLISGKNQRSSKRIALLEAFEAQVAFKSAKYKTALIDISLGGCVLKTPLFKQGGMIYDDASINIPLEKETIKLNAELIRLERDNSTDANILLAAFIFKDVSPQTSKTLSNFLTTIKVNGKRKQ